MSKNEDIDGFEEALEDFLDELDSEFCNGDESEYFIPDESVGGSLGYIRVFIRKAEKGRLKAGSFQMQLASDEWVEARFAIEIRGDGIEQAEEEIRDAWHAHVAKEKQARQVEGS